MGQRKPARRTVEHDVLGLPVINRINSKAKGDSNEHVAGHSLAQWVKQEFARVPQSGGLRWKSSQGISSDLVCQNPAFYFPFTVETKHLRPHRLTVKKDVPFLSRSSALTIWRDQLLPDAVRAEKLPLAMLRVDGMPKGEYYFMLMLRYGAGFFLRMGIEPITYSAEGIEPDIVAFKFTDIVGTSYEDFAAYIKNNNFISKFLKEYAV